MTQDPMRQRFRNIQVPGATQPGQATMSSTPTVSRSDIQTSSRLDDKTAAAEEKPHRLTVYMPIPLHKQFKKHSIDIERDMSEIVVELIEIYMREQAGET